MTMRNRTRRWVAPALAAAAMAGVFASSVPVLAVPATNSTSAVLDTGGNPASGLTADSVITYRTNAPIVAAGTSDQVVTQTFDPAKAAVKGVTVDSVTRPDVTAPEGYTLEYRSGSPAAWSTTPPTYDALTNTYPTLTGVRATGTLTVSSGNAAAMTESLVTADTADSIASPSISGAGGGDGWDVFFAGDRVFNIWHHAAADWASPSTLYLDCHNRKTGAACWSFGGGRTAFQSSGAYYTPWQSTGFYVAATDSVWTVVGRNSPTNDFGVACIKNVSTGTPADCDTPFV